MYNINCRGPNVEPFERISFNFVLVSEYPRNQALIIMTVKEGDITMTVKEGDI